MIEGAPADLLRQGQLPLWTSLAGLGYPDYVDGIARLSRSVASRDSELQTLFESSSAVTDVLEERSQDIVDLMGNSDLVFQELQKRKRAVHALLVNARSLAVELEVRGGRPREVVRVALGELGRVGARVVKADEVFE